MAKRETSTRQAILKAAIEIAGESGITAATMDDIAVRAGVAKGSLYYNFASKDEIFATVLQQALVRLTERFELAVEGKTGVDAMRALVEVFLERIVNDTALIKIVAAEIFRTDRSWVVPFGIARDSALAVFERAIKEIGEERGSPTPQPKLLASAAFGAVLVAGLEWSVFEPETPRTVVTDTLIDPVIRLFLS